VTAGTALSGAASSVRAHARGDRARDGSTAADLLSTGMSFAPIAFAISKGSDVRIRRKCGDSGRRRASGPLALALAGVALTSCTSMRSPDTLVLTPETVLIVVPSVPQEKRDECGLASLASLCGYWGVELPEDVSRRLSARADERDGLSGGELRAALRESGFDAFLFQGTLDWEPTGLYRQVDCRRPPLVMISRDGERRHACLFTGYDGSTGSVYLFDPKRGHLRVPESDFEELWENARRFTLLALPALEPQPAEDGLAPTNSAATESSVAEF
jgi:predicted double-glycine peptidase